MPRHRRSMALARGAAARRWSLRSLGAPSWIVARLTTVEFCPAAAATAAPRRSGLGAHDERVVSSLGLHLHGGDGYNDGGTHALSFTDIVLTASGCRKTCA